TGRPRVPRATARVSNQAVTVAKVALDGDSDQYHQREVEMPNQATIDDAKQDLASAVMKLARRNEALEDFAALVAHEVKSPLQAPLVTDDPLVGVRSALDLVDALLEVAGERPGIGFASPGECLDAALQDIDDGAITTTSDLPAQLPLS